MASACASSKTSPCRMTRAPYPRVADTFASGAWLGMTMVAATPARAAATATPWPWLPADAAMTPRSRALAGRVRMRFNAPRILYEPVRCRFSYLSQTRPWHSSENVRDSQHGVRWMRPARRAAAASTSSRLSSNERAVELDVGRQRFGLSQAVVAVVLHHPPAPLLR